MTAPPDQPYGVVIRSREVWDKLCSVEAAVQVIRSELTPTVKDHGKQLDDQEKRIRALELGETERQKRESGRIDGLEKGRWPLPSVAAVTACTALGLTLYEIAGR
jgi:hypothetical protein